MKEKKITNINIRVSINQKEMFKVLGGADWLRKYIDRQLLSEEIQLRQENVSRSRPT